MLVLPALDCFEKCLALGSGDWNEKTISLRTKELRSVLKHHAEKKGWRDVGRILTKMLRANRNPKEALVLRDLRMQAWMRLAATGKSAKASELPT